MRKLLIGLMVLGLASPALALNIVLTNDDGFETANIQALYRALVHAGHNVILSAPYTGQSGTGGQIAFLTPIPPTSESSEGGLLPAGSAGVGATTIAPQQYYVDGSPTAAMLYGIDVLAPQIFGTFPDLVISGPNEGNNLGIITPHSGTLGAAVAALNKGIPAMAVSANGEAEDQAEVVAGLVLKVLDIVDGRRGIRLPPGIGLNINLPAIDAVNSSVDDFAFAFTRIGTSANFGLQFFENLGDSPVARSFGVPSDINLPGVAVSVPPSSAGYPEDNSPVSETNVLAPLVVTLSPIQGTYAADRAAEGRVRGQLQRLFDDRSGRRHSKHRD